MLFFCFNFLSATITLCLAASICCTISAVRMGLLFSVSSVKIWLCTSLCCGGAECVFCVCSAAGSCYFGVRSVVSVLSRLSLCVQNDVFLAWCVSPIFRLVVSTVARSKCHTHCMLASPRLVHRFVLSLPLHRRNSNWLLRRVSAQVFRLVVKLSIRLLW